jgi:hypothetical protein
VKSVTAWRHRQGSPVQSVPQTRLPRTERVVRATNVRVQSCGKPAKASSPVAPLRIGGLDGPPKPPGGAVALLGIARCRQFLLASGPRSS